MKVFTTMTLMAALAVAPAFAQPKPTVRADVPFDFVVGKAVLPAGQYDIKPGGSNETILVRETAGHSAAFVITYPSGNAVQNSAAALVFRNIGDSHYLETVKSPSGDRSLQNAPAKGGTVSIVRAALVK